MAKLDSLFSIRGKVGDLIFFERNGQSFVKKNTGGFVNGKSHEHPNTKAAQQRFKEVATFVGRFKKAITPLIWRQKDGTFHNQLVSFFSKVRKQSDQENLYLALKQAYEERRLQQLKLNKNSKLYPLDCSYSLEKNSLVISMNLLRSCAQKYPNACLEISFAWMQCDESLELDLVNLQYFYFPLSEKEKPLHQIELQLREEALSSVGFAFPIVSVTVVYQPHASSGAAHPYHFTLTTIL